MSAPQLHDHLWWLVSRASGIVAILLVTVSVGIGLVMAGKVMRRPGLARKLVAVHEQTALAGLIAISVHGLALLGDPFLHPGVKGIAVPFAIGYRSVFTGLGIVAGYLAALLGLSFYVRRTIGPGLWRKLHRATVLVYLLGVIHTLGAGTDAGSAWLQIGLLATGIPVVGLFAVRVLRRPARRPVARRAPRPRLAEEAAR